MRRSRRGINRQAALLLLAAQAALPPWCLASDHELSAQVPQIAQQIARSHKLRIAVVDFTDLQGEVTELGRFLAEELSVELAAAAVGFDVIDRTHLENILAEHRLSARGLVDPLTTQRLKVAGVQGLLTGTVIPLGDSVRLMLKVLDVATAKISAQTEVDIPKTPAIQALIERGIDRSGGAATTIPGAPAKGSDRRQMVRNVAFDLKGCRDRGGRALCTLMVTSLEADTSIHICNSRIMNESGAELWSDENWLGGAKQRDARLAAAVPMSMNVGYPLPAQTTRLTLLEVDFFIGGGYCGDVSRVQYRAVSLAR